MDGKKDTKSFDGDNSSLMEDTQQLDISFSEDEPVSSLLERIESKQVEWQELCKKTMDFAERTTKMYLDVRGKYVDLKTRHETLVEQNRGDRQRMFQYKRRFHGALCALVLFVAFVSAGLLGIWFWVPEQAKKAPLPDDFQDTAVATNYAMPVAAPATGEQQKNTNTGKTAGQTGGQRVAARTLPAIPSYAMPRPSIPASVVTAAPVPAPTPVQNPAAEEKKTEKEQDVFSKTIAFFSSDDGGSSKSDQITYMEDGTH